MKSSIRLLPGTVFALAAILAGCSSNTQRPTPIPLPAATVSKPDPALTQRAQEVAAREQAVATRQRELEQATGQIQDRIKTLQEREAAVAARAAAPAPVPAPAPAPARASTR